jgi:protein-S-isoprenylcysteine O-methyltransferase Ste14
MKIVKKRIKISQLFGVIVFGYYLLGASYWSLQDALVGDALFFLGTVMVGVGVLGRAWCLSYIGGNKRNMVIQHGPYSLCRNPLYLFSFIGAIGIGLATKTFVFPLIVLAVFVIYYPLVIKKEEAELKLKFGVQFEDYMKKTRSRIIPSFRGYTGLERTEINLRSFRKGVFELIFFIIPLGIFPFLETLHAMGSVPFFYYIY